MPRAKKRFPGESGDAAGQKKKSKGAGSGGGLTAAGADSGMEKIVSSVCCLRACVSFFVSYFCDSMRADIR